MKNTKDPHFIPSKRSPWAVIYRKENKQWHFHMSTYCRSVARMIKKILIKDFGPANVRIVRVWVPTK